MFSVAKDLCTYSRTAWGHSRTDFWVFDEPCERVLEGAGRSSSGGVGRPKARRTDTGVDAVTESVSTISSSRFKQLTFHLGPISWGQTRRWSNIISKIDEKRGSVEKERKSSVQ